MSVYEALTLVCSFATLLVGLVSLIVKLIDMKTKNNTAHNFGRVSGVINTLITATVFSTVYIRVELPLDSFCIFIIPKTKRIANYQNQVFARVSNTSDNVSMKHK